MGMEGVFDGDEMERWLDEGIQQGGLEFLCRV